MQKLSMVLGLCILAVACGSKDYVNRGGEGESCVSHNDCSGSLICYNNICSKSATPVVGIDGGATTPAPVVSGPGESCTKRADCASGLGCFDGVCAISAPVPVQVDAGIATANTALGTRGETCTVNSDCEKSLVCIPNPDAQGLGVCDLANYGLTAGGKTCAAECEKDIDCCELPIGLTGSSVDGGVVAYNSCSDLVKVLALSSATPTTCADVPAVARECFLYKTYCDCGATAATNPWVCSSGTCSYAKACSKTGETLLGCPTKTRSSLPVSDCNLTSNKCAGTGPAAGCTQNDECVTRGTSDGAGGCVSNECICVIEPTIGVNGACYRKCSADLDCAHGYVCDLVKSICKVADGCTTDVSCKLTTQDVSAKCVISTGATSGSCKIPCKIDQDCSPSGLLSTKFNGTVCGADGYCGLIGQCSSNADCPAKVVSGVNIKMFCAAPVAGASSPYASAVTGSKP